MAGVVSIAWNVKTDATQTECRPILKTGLPCIVGGEYFQCAVCGIDKDTKANKVRKIPNMFSA